MSSSLIGKARKSRDGVFAEEIKCLYGTVYTVDFVVDKTLDLAFKYVPEDVDPLSLTWCDPACGDGNFLIRVYDRLMACPSRYTPAQSYSRLSPREKSRHILTFCIHGVEILRSMQRACKIRLVTRHAKTLYKAGATDEEIVAEVKELWPKLNIHWGNTICLPEDTKQEWYKPGQLPDNRPEKVFPFEGPILPDEIRDRKYDMIVGNPPYTHLRNLKNRRYAAYPRQRDMAQVFVRWALDHMTGKGTTSYNISDVWLNIKLCDGAVETRRLVSTQKCEIIQNQEIQDYSSGEGGALQTMVIAMMRGNGWVYNDAPISTAGVLKSGFINSIRASKLSFPYKATTVDDTYCGSVKRAASIEWDKIPLVESDMAYLVMKYIMTPNSYFGGFRVCNNIESCSTGSEVIYVRLPYNQAIAICAFLNTKLAYKYVDLWSKRLTGAGYKHGNIRYRFSKQLLPTMVVPDFDHYKATHPDRFQAYMKWVEDNMRDKEKFLAGIDEQFQKLIG